MNFFKLSIFLIAFLCKLSLGFSQIIDMPLSEDGIAHLTESELIASGVLNDCIAENTGCPNGYPRFQNTIPDTIIMAGDSCLKYVSIDYKILHCLTPNYILNHSISFNSISPNFGLMTNTIVGSNSYSTSYSLEGLLWPGSFDVTVDFIDPVCATSVSEEFRIDVDGRDFPSYQCKFLFWDIEDDGTVMLDALEIVCPIQENECVGLNQSYFASFSSDPNDNKRSYDCTDIGDNVVTMFVWEVADYDRDGDLDTIFIEPCFGIQTIVDPNDNCPPNASLQCDIISGLISVNDNEAKVSVCTSDDIQLYRDFNPDSRYKDQWIITDANKNILELKTESRFPFKLKGEEFYTIYNLRMDINNPLNGIPANVEDIQDCMALSNPVFVIPRADCGVEETANTEIEDLLNKTSDTSPLPCDASLAITFPVDNFSCDYVGQQDLLIEITDQYGMTYSCPIIVNVYDPFDVCPSLEIPTLSEWGFIILALLLLIFNLIRIKQKESARRVLLQ